MKLKIKISLLLILFTVCAGQAKAVSLPVTINGTVKGLPDGTRIDLVPGATHANEQPVATAVVSNGNFLLKGAIATEPRLYYLRTAGIGGQTSLVLQPGKIVVTAMAKLTGSAENKYYEFTDLVVKGSEANNQYVKKIAPKNELNALYIANQEANKEVVTRRNQAYAAKDTTLLKSIIESPAWKKAMADESQFFKQAQRNLRKIVTDNKDSFWGPLLALDIYSYFTPEDKIMYAELSPAAQKSYYGKILGDLINPVGFKGQQAPLLNAKNEAGQAAEIGVLKKGHQYVLVDFWASWCVPCRKSIPALKKVYADYRDKGLQIVSISIDKKEGDWLKAQQEEKLPWPSFLDHGATANAWKVQAIPAMFLLDEQGKVVLENMSLEEVITKLKAI
ncbi:TlpA disulfide reductase family protein [Pedobacter sp. D749]|uniref:TlpA disulfide reductase family protein n=1 Tax=Pedobacter sp. D749 TaxID=2856523 RepID=UPI001C589498|nr:TlpA disulfide reductase family protein [Pedobacter sp. D749]QXU42862.1 AhpC/TSA family protein [Pedobacter sp. D749]